MWFSQMRAVLNSYGFSNSDVLITPEFQYLNGYTNTLAAQDGFNVISASANNGGYNMTLGYVDGTYVPGRVDPANVGTSADTALDSAAVNNFENNFWAYIGNDPLCLITSHILRAAGNTSAYELLYFLTAYEVMNMAGYKLLTTQSATDKNIGWVWTNMSSTKDSSGNISLTFNSTNFLDGKDRHELDVVMPYTVNQAKLGSDYWIDVDGKNVYFGQPSNAIETLQTTLEQGIMPIYRRSYLSRHLQLMCSTQFMIL